MATRQPETQKIIINAGFGDFLNALWVEQRDRQVLLALTELWWDTTNTFHFSFGEMTLTPTDFTVITRLRLGGRRLFYYENAHGDPHYLLEQLGIMIDYFPQYNPAAAPPPPPSTEEARPSKRRKPPRKR
ncbi:hypothetical protein L1049_010037 [Liquidambar formosana]|uniref:Aminotransferase-like plant mobile domain-containing protein n=1 Tax=Liquidambar formosana TaxID=63359 RepID=A0AAP0N935_LIQFO